MAKRYLLICAIGLMAVSAISAQRLGSAIEGEMQEMVAGDRNELVLPLQFQSVALRTLAPQQRKDPICDGFCLHALLTGTADKVLVANIETDNMDQPLSFEDKATEFSLQRRDVCPKTNFATGPYGTRLSNSGADGKPPVDADEVMKLRISKGDCLISAPSAIGRADVVLTRARRDEGPRYAARIGFSLTTKSYLVDRWAAHIVDKAGADFKEVYRWTGIEYFSFPKLLIPSPLFGGETTEINMGWWRTKKFLNRPERQYWTPDWVGFLIETLKLDLSLEGEVSRDTLRQEMEKIVQSGQAPTPVQWDIISTYFNDPGSNNSSAIEEQDYLLALDIIQDPTFPMPELYSISKYANENKTLAENKAFADLLWARLERGQTWSDNLNVSASREITRVANLLSMFSGDVLEGQFDRLERLSHDPLFQEHGYRLLKRMHVYGEKSVPVLLRLLETGVDGNIRGNHYQHLYLAGIGGLCMLGPEGKSALPRLQEMIAAGDLPRGRGYEVLLTNTLMGMGADAELIWPLWERVNTGPTREIFEKRLKLHKITAWNCSY